MTNEEHSQILLYPDESELKVRTIDEVLRDLHKYPPELSSGLEMVRGHTIEDLLRDIHGFVHKPVFVYERGSMSYEKGIIKEHWVNFDSIELYDVNKHLLSLGYKLNAHEHYYPECDILATFKRKPGANFNLKQIFGLTIISPGEAYGQPMDCDTFSRTLTKDEDPDRLDVFGERVFLRITEVDKPIEYVEINPDGTFNYNPVEERKRILAEDD